MSKLAIVGSREYPDEKQVRDFVHALRKDTVVVSGGARGVDSWAADQARLEGLEVIELLPDYETYHYMAPMIRNSKIAQVMDEMVAFWDTESTGTRDAITKALNAGKPVNVLTRRKS